MLGVELVAGHNREDEITKDDVEILTALRDLFTALSKEEIAEEAWRTLHQEAKHGQLTPEEKERLAFLIGSFAFAKLTAIIEESFRIPSRHLLMAMGGVRERGRRG